jgi:transposase-like protein
MDIPPILDIIEHFKDEKSCISWLVDNGIVEIPKCCGKNMKQGSQKDKPYLFQCDSGRLCMARRSVFKNTFFGSSKLPCNKIMLLCYFWISNCRHAEIHRLTGIGKVAIGDWIRFLLDLISDDMENLPDMDVQIGGEGIIVEIDETKIARRKYNRGHRVKGAWVVGGVERTPERKFFAMRVPDRSEDTLQQVILKFIKPGSIIFTDCWSGYSTTELEAKGFTHLTVNHSLHYVDPDTGVHTNTIEGTWSGMKLCISKRHRSGALVDGYLDAFTWRRRFADNQWDRLLFCISRARYDD